MSTLRNITWGDLHRDARRSFLLSQIAVRIHVLSRSTTLFILSAKTSFLSPLSPSSWHQSHPSLQSIPKTSSHPSTPSSITTLLQLPLASSSLMHSCFSSFCQASFSLPTGFWSLCTPSMPSLEGEFAFLRILKWNELTDCTGSDQLLDSLFFWRV